MIIKKSKKYSTVSLPKSLIKKVDKLIGDEEDGGFSSRAEFIKSAIRKELENIRLLKKSQEVF